jgi:hypothetical protein
MLLSFQKSSHTGAKNSSCVLRKERLSPSRWWFEFDVAQLFAVAAISTPPHSDETVSCGHSPNLFKIAQAKKGTLEDQPDGPG